MKENIKGKWRQKQNGGDNIRSSMADNTNMEIPHSSTESEEKKLNDHIALLPTPIPASCEDFDSFYERLHSHIHPGRPNFDTMFDSIAASSPPTSSNHVFCCGPDPLIRSIQTACDAKRWNVYFENFYN